MANPTGSGRTQADKERSKQMSRSVTANPPRANGRPSGRPGQCRRPPAERPRGGSGRPPGGRRRDRQPGASRPSPDRRTRRSPTTLLTWGTAALVVVIVVVLVVVQGLRRVQQPLERRGGNTGLARRSSRSSRTSRGRSSTPSATNSTVAPIYPPIVISGQKPLTYTSSTGTTLPGVFFFGAEYCPHCAAERWSIILALSRFGTFHHLSNMLSSSTDVDPNTQTFSFYKSTYTSPYIVFKTDEFYSNQLNAAGNNYTILQPPTKAEAAPRAEVQLPDLLPGAVGRRDLVPVPRLRQQDPVRGELRPRHPPGPDPRRDRVGAEDRPRTRSPRPSWPAPTTSPQPCAPSTTTSPRRCARARAWWRRPRRSSSASPVQVLTRAVRSPEAGPPSPRRPGGSWLSWGLAFGGLGIAIYLTVVHYGGLRFPGLPEPGRAGSINCEAVLTSPQSLRLRDPGAGARPRPTTGDDRALLAVGLAGGRPPGPSGPAGPVAWSGSASSSTWSAPSCSSSSRSACWCTAVHVVTFVQLILVVATVPTMLGWGGRARQAGAAVTAAPAADGPRRAGRAASRPGRWPLAPGGTERAERQPARRSSTCLRSTSLSPPQMPWGSRIRIA